MSGKVMNILLCGVGGQGVLLASEILSGAALDAGHDVKKSEVHGMAQRGGAVTSHVRWGEIVHSPLIEEGRADVLLSFEPGEAMRWLHFLKEDGVVVTAETPIYSVLVSSGIDKYPEHVVEDLKERCAHIYTVDAQAEAKAIGNPRTVNTLLLGMVSRFTNISEAVWKKAVENRVPPHSIEMNLKAFARGCELAKK